MSLNNPSGNIIGGPIEETVAKQLQIRQRLHNERIGFTDDRHLLYLNGNTGWVRVSSSVNTRDKVTNVFNYDLAKQNVLLGGTLQDGDSIRQGLFSGENASYKDTVQGYRPMAGITGFTVVSRSYAGAIKTGSFELTVNSTEDLSALEQLYFRPGFTILVEYGHSIYLDNNNTIQKQVSNIVNYFTYTERSKIIKKGLEIRNKSNYNYDFMYAYVTNFSWQSNDMGGYNCIVNFTSAGDLIESLSIAISGGSSFKEPVDTSKTLISQATTLHTMLYVINNADTKEFFKDDDLSKDDSSTLRKTTIETALVTYCNPLWSRINKKLEENNRSLKVFRTQVGETFKGGNWFRYINFAALLEMINQCFVPKTSKDERLFNFFIGNDKKSQTYFTTFKQHFCIDPGIAIIPKSYLSDTNFKINVAGQDCGEVDENDILDIQINIDFVMSLLENLLDQDKISNKTVYDFIIGILDKLTDSFGQINDFAIHTDDDQNIHYIIDKTVVPDRNQMLNPKYKLNIFGVNSTVETFKLNSTIPSSMTAYVAAAASTTSSDMRSRLHAMFRWNEGLEDRTIKILSLQDEELNDKSESFKKDLILLARYLKNINISEYYIDYNRKEVIGVKQIHQKLMSLLAEYYTNGAGKADAGVNASGLIPLTLSFTMKGISGIKIGQAFTISDELLPDRYKGRIAFMISHLSNSIVNNKWITQVDALMMSLDVPAEGDNEIKSVPEINVEDLEKEFKFFVEEGSNEISTDLVFKKPLPVLQIRNDKPGGLGYFGASRDGGTRLHNGVDYKATPGTIVYAAIPGEVTKGADFSKGFPRLLITGTGDYKGISVKYGYVDWQRGLGPSAENEERPYIILDEVTQGQPFGVLLDINDPAQSMYNLSYASNISTHLHLEVMVNGKYVNAELLNWV